MEGLGNVQEAIESFAAVRGEGRGIVVPTTTLLPGGDALSILVTRGEGGTFSVSDRGAARTSVLDTGLVSITSGDRRRANELAEQAGIAIEGDAFVAYEVSIEQIVAAILYVADVSRSWATYVIDKARRSTEREAADYLEHVLTQAFTTRRVVREATILGGSNTPHRVDFLLDFADNSTVIDLVSSAPPSIAFTHLKFSDIRRSHEAWAREAAVQDINSWSAESLSLLGQSATHIRNVRSSWGDLASRYH